LVALVALVVPALALAASPKKGATYVANKPQTPNSVSKKVSIKVGKSGKTARALFYCGTGRAPDTSPRFNIKKGRFSVAKKTGSITLWSLTHGHFISSTKATAYLNVVTTCDGRSDGNITLKLKTTP
jgi:hypothetical protein